MSISPFPRGRASVVGAATFGQGEAPGFSSTDLAAIAARDALAQAGLTPADVDGLFFCHPTDTFGGLSFAQYLGIHPKVTDNNRTGGSAFQTYVEHAAFLLDAGLINVALIAFGNNQRTATGKMSSTVLPMTYEAPYRPVNPVSSYALATSRHMHLYGTTQEQLGAVALAARAWAQLNPEAFRRDPLDMTAYMSSRTVSSPLKVLDCCLVTDGAAALVLTRTERARDLVAAPIAVLGAASATTHREIGWMDDITRTAAVDSGARAFAAAGVTAADIDVAELYDAFTITPILFLEDLGFCPKGEGGSFVQDGHIAPGGGLPVNTNGGGLSCCHPGMYGMFTLVEAVRQLTGVCGARQVADAQLAVAHGNGGVLSSQATVVLGTLATL